MATPTLVQFVKGGGTSAGTSKRHLPLPNVVLSGNIVIVGLQSNNAKQPSSVTDDKSGTYTQYQRTNDVTNGQHSMYYYRENVTDGPQKITINFSGTNTYLTCWASEWYNISTSASTDVSAGTTDNTSTYTPGSMTTTASDDLVITYIAEDSVDPFVTDEVVAGFTVPSGFTMLAADRWVGEAVAYKIQTAAGAVNPAWATGTARNYIVSQASWKSASAGTAPSASPRTVHVWHQGLDYHGVHASPFVCQIPFQNTGNMLAMGYVGLLDPGNVTDSVGNTWTAGAASIANTSGGNSGHVRNYYSLSPTISAGMTVSIAFTGSGSAPGDTAIFYEVLLNGTPGHDANASGTLTGSSTSYQIGSITPTRTGWIMATVGEDDHTSLSVDDGVFVASTDPTEETSPWANDENNAWSFKLNTGTTAYQPTYTTDAAAGPVAWMSDAFSAAPAGRTTKNTRSAPLGTEIGMGWRMNID